MNGGRPLNKAMPMMSEKVFTYAELAAEMGRTPEAARQIVKRRRWRKSAGNDGKVRVYVPVEEFETERLSEPRTTAERDQGNEF